MNRFLHRSHNWWPGLLTLFVLLAIYVSTLQTDVNGHSHGYTLDTGEIQVALNVWGTIHYTGYPHYTILSSLVVSVCRVFNMNPAVAASFSSLLWSLLGLFFFYLILLLLMPEQWVLLSLVTLAMGLVETFWLHSVIAEVYSFSLFLMALAVWLGVKLGTTWQQRKWVCLLLVLGTAVAHHRIFVLLLPLVGLLLGPNAWVWHKSHKRYALYTPLLFLAPFLVYFYLPLRKWQHSVWVYGQPDTWVGFWQQFTGSEVTGDLMRLPQSLGDLVDNAHFLNQHLTQQLPWVVLLPGIIGLFWLMSRFRLTGMAFLYGTAVFPLFIYLFPRAVWAPAVLMPALFCVMVGNAYLLAQLGKNQPLLRFPTWLVSLLLALFLWQQNLPFVQELTLDPSGREIINLLQPVANPIIDENNKPVVAIPWGPLFFAAAYGKYVTQELAPLQLVDHRADFSTLLTKSGRILTPGLLLTYWPPSQWQTWLGPIRFSAITPDIVAIYPPSPAANQPVNNINFQLGNGIRIRSLLGPYRQNDKITLTIFWEATQPIDYDYSVAVHLLTQFPPTNPTDLLTQADAIHPVQGWYPTSHWSIGEIVTDQYQLLLPPGQQEAVLAITMYRLNETGQFVNGQWFVSSINSTP